MNFEFYEKDGRQYSRITSILDYFPAPELVDWKIDVGRREARRISTIALKIGDNVDEAIKAEICKAKIPRLKSEEAKNCFEAYKQWQKDYQLGELTCGTTVFDDEWGVAGTPDFYDEDTVIDSKCSSEIRLQYWLQTEFYGRKLGKKYKAILRLDKNLAIYEYKKMPLNDFHWATVCGLITAYRFFNKSVTDGTK